MSACLQRGLTMRDLDEMTLGQAIDFVVVYNNLMTPEEDRINTATQTDFDKF